MYKNRMKEIRLNKGFTLEYVSYKSDVSVGYLCHLERGSRKNPSMQVMERIAWSLESTVADVFFS